MRDLLIAFEKAKKNIVKVAVIQSIERLIQPLQTSAVSKTHNESLLWTEIINLYKKAKKWCSNDDLRPAALSLMAVILVNSRIDMFASNIDSFINSELCSKNKVREYAYAPILQLLRGRFFEDTLDHVEEMIKGTYDAGLFFSSITRAQDEQTHGTVSNRLNNIVSMMLFQKKGPLPEEHKETIVLIVAQIAAYSMTFGAKIISQLLDTSRAGNSPDCYYIGVKALRIILDPASGFQTYAFSRIEPDFQVLLRDFPYDLKPSLLSIYTYINEVVGVHFLGTSGKVIDLAGTEQNPELFKGDFTLSISQLVFFNGLESSTPTTGSSNFLSNVGSVGSLSARKTMSLSSINQFENTITSSPILLDFQSLTTHNESTLNTNDSLSRHDSDDTIAKTIAGWFTAVGCPLKDAGKYCHSSNLTDKARLKRKILRSEQLNALDILEQLLPIIKFAPSPEFIGGKYFIGSLLTHPVLNIGVAVGKTLIATFKNYSDLRLG